MNQRRPILTSPGQNQNVAPVEKLHLPDLSTLLARAMLLANLSPGMPATATNRARLLAALRILPGVMRE